MSLRKIIYSDYPRSTCVHQLIAQQAMRSPTAVAVGAAEGTLTYAELAAQANQLCELLHQKGVRRGDLIGVCLGRNSDMIVALLGILAIGAAYVPLDPAFPAERLGHMADDAKLKFILTSQNVLFSVPHSGAAILFVEESKTAEPASEISRYFNAGAEDLAYVLYTSGSTGKPKGVEVTHRALTNLLWSMREKPGCTASDIFLSVTTLSFDIAALEIFLPLIVGGRVELASAHVAADGRLLRERIEQCKPTILQATPATWRMLIKAGWEGTPGLVALCGGDILQRELANQLLGRVAVLWNMYGPTETTVWSTLARIESGDNEISIGVPIANTQVYVLDEAMQPVSDGVPGELFIGGDGVARGYRNQPVLNEQKFIVDPFSSQPNARLYRTGDMVRSRKDGSLVFLGRCDRQVKVNGFRIELGEIEATLALHPGVEQAVVKATVDSQGANQLTAYLVCREGEPPTFADLRRFLRLVVPDYMVPLHFVFLTALPLTANYKIDINALPIPSLDAVDCNLGAGPRSRLETQILAIWRQTLEVDTLGIHDNFFDAGGSSLKAVQLLTQIEHVTGTRLPLDFMFQIQTVAAMASRISLRDWRPLQHSLVAIQPGGSRVPFFAVPGAGGHVLMFAQLARLLGSEQPFYGLQARGVDDYEEPFKSVTEMASHYVDEIRSKKVAGPYFIGGTCTGGVVAYEMAQQLVAQGERVTLAIFDTSHPSSERSYLRVTATLWWVGYVWTRGINYLRALMHMSPRKWFAFVRTKAINAAKTMRPHHAISQEKSEFQQIALYRKNMRVIARYHVRNYRGKVLNIVASGRPIEHGVPDTRQCWESLALDGSRTVFIPAKDSGQLFVSPNVEHLAKELTRWSDENVR